MRTHLAIAVVVGRNTSTGLRAREPAAKATGLTVGLFGLHNCEASSLTELPRIGERDGAASHGEGIVGVSGV